LIFALAVLLSLSVALSNQANQNRDLAQEMALLEYRLRELEGKRNGAEPAQLVEDS